MRADRYIKLPLRKNIFGVVTVLCLLFACSKNSMDTPASVDCSASKSFATEVNPIVQTSCATDSDCHGSGSSSGPGDYVPIHRYSMPERQYAQQLNRE
jgi:hypothetical protein